MSKFVVARTPSEVTSEGSKLTLPQLREIARFMEESEKQARSIEGGSGSM